MFKTEFKMPNQDKPLPQKIESSIERSPERLDLYDDLAIKINELFQSRLITEAEGQKAMAFLRNVSEGRDNLATASLIKKLAELNFD